MTSKQFYRHTDAALTPQCARLGFKRSRRTTSLWTCDLQNGTLVYEISKSIRHGFIPYIGGRFGVHIDLTATPDPQIRSLESSISFTEYYDESDLRTIAEIRDRVLRKIVSQKPPDDFHRALLESHSPIMSLDIGREFRPHGIFTLPYLDVQDVDDWATLFATHLEKQTRGVENSPRFFMRGGSGHALQ